MDDYDALLKANIRLIGEINILEGSLDHSLRTIDVAGKILSNIDPGRCMHLDDIHRLADLARAAVDMIYHSELMAKKRVESQYEGKLRQRDAEVSALTARAEEAEYLLSGARQALASAMGGVRTDAQIAEALHAMRGQIARHVWKSVFVERTMSSYYRVTDDVLEMIGVALGLEKP